MATHQLTSGAEAAGQRLDVFLAGALPDCSRAEAQRLIGAGAVTVGGVIITKPSLKLSGHEKLCVVVPEAEPSQLKPQKMALDILFEDEHLLVLNKPAGLVVHPAAGHGEGTLVNALLAHCGESLSGIGGVKRPGIVHRLDKDTSGLMVVAKTDAAHRGLAAQFAGHQLARRYEAVVWGVPSPRQGTYSGAIGRSSRKGPAARKKMAVTEGGKEARTHYTVLKSFGLVASVLSCELETGRTHQIRVHLAHAGHAVLGDPVYGRATSHRQHPSLKKLGEEGRQFILTFPRQALHAIELRFKHPVNGKAKTFKIQQSQDLKQLLTMFERI